MLYFTLNVHVILHTFFIVQSNISDSPERSDYQGYERRWERGGGGRREVRCDFPSPPPLSRV